MGGDIIVLCGPPEFKEGPKQMQCHGYPRIIDNVMSDALILGAQLGRACIDSEVMLAAVNEQTLD